MSVLINGKLTARSDLRLGAPTKKTRKRRRPKCLPKPFDRQTVAEVSRDFARWKRRPEFKAWKRRQFLKQGGLCYYCQVYLGAVRVNVEHITPRSKGGTNNPKNLVLSCSDCNRAKGSEPISAERQADLKRANKPNRGTYLANRSHYERLYGEYSDEAVLEKLRSL